MSGISVNPSGQNYTAQQLLQSSAPKESGWNKFGRIVSNVASGVLSGAPILGKTFGGLGADSGFDQQYELIRLQQEIQRNSQMYSTISNVSKSKHDAAMSAVRNFK